MSTPTKSAVTKPTTPTKSAANQTAGSDEIIALYLAAHGHPVINYKQMAAMDLQNRTASAFEHKFRKWRARAKELSEEHENSDKVVDTEVKDNGEKEDNAKRNGTSNDVEYTFIAVEDASFKKAEATKKGRAKTSKVKVETAVGEPSAPGVDVEMAGMEIEGVPTKRPTMARKEPAKHAPISEKPAATKNDEAAVTENDEGKVDENELEEDVTKKANVTKKRDEKSMEGATDDPPVKKAKIVKKGTAKIVKKVNKPRGGTVEVSDDGDEIEEPKAKTQKRKTTAPAKPRGKGMTKAETVEVEGEGAQSKHLSGDEGLVDMQFE